MKHFSTGTWRKAAIIHRLATLLLPACAVAATPACAASPGWQDGDVVISLGAGAIDLHESSAIAIAGTPVPGARIRLDNALTAGAEVQYFIRAPLSVALTFGVPPRTRIAGEGALAPFGQLGAVRYGLGAAVLRYHLAAHGVISPYVGVGIAHFFPITTRDGALQGLSVSTATNVLVQGGVDLHLTHRLGLFASAAYIPLRTHSEGTIMVPGVPEPLPATASITLDPTVLQAGAFYRF